MMDDSHPIFEPVMIRGFDDHIAFLTLGLDGSEDILSPWWALDPIFQQAAVDFADMKEF